MKKGRLFGLVSATVLALTSLPSLGLSAAAANVGDKLSVQGGQTQHKGNCDGYSYEVWLDNTGGSGSMTLGKGATFKAEWNASVNRGNFLARRGLDFGSKKKATDYDYIGMDYKANYQQTGSASGNSRLCVYGWFENQGAAGNPPLVEYYIIEDWKDWCPNGNGKMVTIDGAQYKIFQLDHTGPTIHGNTETFKQYFSVRQDKRTSGHITVSEHFKAWAAEGWGIGNLYEVALNAEGWQSSGVADVTELDVYTDPSKAPGGSSTQPQQTTAPSQNPWQQQPAQTTAAPSNGGSNDAGKVLKVGNGNPNQHKGNSDGFSYEIWLDKTGGSGSMTLGKGATFKAEWNASVPSGNFLARRGLDFGSKKKATDYDYIGMDYAATYQQTGSASGNSRLCVYGWFENKGAAGNPPLVEYYIIEDWKDWCPNGNGKMVTIDGAQYKIFQLDHTGPTIHGNTETFKQYFSVRQDKRTSGHITVSEHFKAWAAEGWGIGNLYEVALNAEGWQSSGVADVTELNVYTTRPGTETTAPAVQTTAPQETNPSNPTTTKGNSSQVSAGGIAAHQNNDYTFTEGGEGFKDYMGPYFRIGTCLNGFNARNQQVTDFIKKNFNSITCENEMKPDSICVQQASSGDNIAISLNQADPILKFCEQNGIGLRGHTFVWYSQTPEWIFKENMQSNSGGFVSPERMNKRLESMIKNTFEALKKNYPNLKVYSYDVCNELFKNDGGGFRGDGGEYSNWWKCYGNDSFVINAFKYARMYAPKDCKLYMNDYNEYFVTKCDDLYKMAKKIQAEGDYIDGIGMQSHMHAADFGGTGSATKSTDPQFGTYADAIDKFNSLGLDVQITELDVTNCAAQNGANLYVDIFKVAMERSAKISSLTLWGHCDSASWRNSYQDGGKPLPFDGNCRPKSFYQQILDLTKTVKPGTVEVESTTVATTQATTVTTKTETKPVTTTTQATTEAPTQTTTQQIEKPQAKKLGDTDDNGKTDVSDAVLLARFLAEDTSVSITAVGQANADCNKNGKPDQEDITMILKAIAKLITL